MSSTLAHNKKAQRDYQILETIEAGLSLINDEAKKIRLGKVEINHSFAKVFADKNKNQEIWLVGSFIEGENPNRLRKLLLKRKEIDRLIGRINEKNNTLLPKRIYTKKGIIKVELALAKGQKQYEKKEKIKEKDLKREIARSLRR